MAASRDGRRRLPRRDDRGNDRENWIPIKSAPGHPSTPPLLVDLGAGADRFPAAVPEPPNEGGADRGDGGCAARPRGEPHLVAPQVSRRRRARTAAGLVAGRRDRANTTPWSV